MWNRIFFDQMAHDSVLQMWDITRLQQRLRLTYDSYAMRIQEGCCFVRCAYAEIYFYHLLCMYLNSTLILANFTPTINSRIEILPYLTVIISLPRPPYIYPTLPCSCVPTFTLCSRLSSGRTRTSVPAFSPQNAVSTLRCPPCAAAPCGRAWAPDGWGVIALYSRAGRSSVVEAWRTIFPLRPLCMGGLV